MVEYHQLTQWLPKVIQIADAAADAILVYYQNLTAHQIETKSDQTPVTQADLAAHQVIEAALSKLTPDLPVLSEESDHLPYEVRSQWPCYWLVDPLDGTRGFIRHSDEFTVNIALVCDGKPLLGVILQPVGKRCYSAIAGEDAYVHVPEQAPRALLLSGDHKKLTRILSGRFDKSVNYMKDMMPGELRYEWVQANSSIKFGMLAEDCGDLYCRFGPTSEWDTAAGQCILEAAGGAVVDFQGEPLQYNAKSSLINPSFLAVRDATMLDQYLSLIESIRRKL